jgi:hypothetical protein
LTIADVLDDLESDDAPQIWKKWFWASARGRRLQCSRLTMNQIMALVRPRTPTATCKSQQFTGAKKLASIAAKWLARPGGRALGFAAWSETGEEARRPQGGGGPNLGPGIAPKDIGKVFDRFYRVDKSRSRNRGGAGLGLSIAQRAVRAHDTAR